jgi:release factor glutamine methyltransferase
MIWTVLGVLNWTEQRFRERGVGSARLDAQLLLAHVLQHDRVYLYTHFDQPLAPDELAAYRALIQRRLGGEPVAYLVGKKEFRSLELSVDARVLVPRPDTEILVETALTLLTADGGRVVDIGTGSGAIALALDAELPDVTVWATDASLDALDVARANVAGCAATRVRIAHGSWFEALPETLRGHLELIVSNPPYVAEHEVRSLPEEVSGFEPRAALVAGPTGYEALEHLLAHAREWMVPEGVLVCELAPHQADAMTERAKAHGYADVAIRMDLAGRRRVLVARAG